MKPDLCEIVVTGSQDKTKVLTALTEQADEVLYVKVTKFPADRLLS